MAIPGLVADITCKPGLVADFISNHVMLMLFLAQLLIAVPGHVVEMIHALF
jgi:hypothetical protein